jgi:hypothetical protein
MPPGYPSTMGDIYRHDPYSRYEDVEDLEQEPDEDSEVVCNDLEDDDE